mgnify:CR=1 FL=1
MIEIRKVRNGDERSLAFVQAESWKAAFKNILSQETLDKCANFNRSITMYRKLLDEKQGNGYILEDVSKAGYSTIMLWVFVDNVRAIEFYKKYGFMASGKEKTTFGAVEEIYISTQGNYKGEHPPQGCLLQEHLAHTLNQVWSLALPLPLHL